MAAATTSIHVVLALRAGVHAARRRAPGGTLDRDGVARRLPPVDLGDPAELVAPASAGVLAARRLADGGRYERGGGRVRGAGARAGRRAADLPGGVMRAKAGQNALAARHFQAIMLERAAGPQGDERGSTSSSDWRPRRPS
jgi:hypothetical protein